jgi:hypothetical protein
MVALYHIVDEILSQLCRIFSFTSISGPFHENPSREKALPALARAWALQISDLPSAW